MPVWILQNTLDEYASRCGKLEGSLDEYVARCKQVAYRHGAKNTARKERWSMGVAANIMRKKAIFKPRRNVLRKEHLSMRDETIVYKKAILKPLKDVKVTRLGYGSLVHLDDAALDSIASLKATIFAAINEA